MKRELIRDIDAPEQIEAAVSWVRAFAEQGLQRGPVSIRLTRPRRTLDQNAKLWPMLSDVSRQVDWYGSRLRPEEWKDVFTAALKRQKTVPGIDGGFVVLGAHTSRMTKRELSDLIELIYAFGAERDVEWSEPSQRAIHDLRRVA